jgi:RNA polymerase sigma-70 factor (ECF subfamily)
LANPAEEISFEQLYKDYGEKILNLAYRFTGNAEVSRDLTQDVFLKVYQNLTSFRQASQPFTWIYRIAMNHFINHIKREKKWKWQQLLDKKVGDALLEDSQSGEFRTSGHFENPDKALEKAEREKIILNLINSIPIKYRAPLVLQRYEGLSNKEIAETLSLSVSAVETRIHRAKKMLMEKLQPWIKHI